MHGADVKASAEGQRTSENNQCPVSILFLDTFAFLPDTWILYYPQVAITSRCDFGGFEINAAKWNFWMKNSLACSDLLK